MHKDSNQQSNFLFDQKCSESVVLFKSIIMEKSQLTNQQSIEHIHQSQQIATNQQNHPLNIAKQISTNLIVIKSSQNIIVDFQDEIEEVPIPVIQQSNTQKREYSETNKIKFIYQHQEFDHDQEIDHEQGQAQSSIRKLYKAMKRDQSQIIHLKMVHEAKLEGEKELYSHPNKRRKSTLSNLSERFNSVLYIVPPTKMIKAIVKIVDNSFLSLQTIFHFYLLEQKRLIMTATKKNYRISSNFEIYGKERGHIQKIAAIQSNYSRSQYKLMVNRQQRRLQQKISSQNNSFTSSIIHIQTPVGYALEQISYLSYSSNILGLSQQKVEVITPKKHIQKTDRFSNLKNSFQNCQYQRISKFTNKTAQKDRNGKFVLDFKDQSIIESSRNMILENQFGFQCMILGKKRDDIFMVNVMEPFNLLQAFFVATCNLDRKLFIH